MGTGSSLEVLGLLVVVSAIVRPLYVDATNSLDAFPFLVLIQMVGSPCSAPCCLQKGIVRASPVLGLIQEDVESLLVDPGLRELNLGLLLLCGINDGGAADLSNLASLAVERPAADLVPDDVLDEQHAAVEAQGELVEQLNVFQHVVIRVAGI